MSVVTGGASRTFWPGWRAALNDPHQVMYLVCGVGVAIALLASVLAGSSAVAAAGAVVVTCVPASVAIGVLFLHGAYRYRPAALALHLALLYWFFWPAVWGALGRSNDEFSVGRLSYEYFYVAPGPKAALTSLTLILIFSVALSALALVVERRSPVASLASGRNWPGAEEMNVAPFVVAIGLGWLVYLALSGVNAIDLLRYITDGRSGQAPWEAAGGGASIETVARTLAAGLILAGAGAVLTLAVTRLRHVVTSPGLAVAVVFALLSSAAVVAETGSRVNLIIALFPAVLAGLTVAGTGRRPPLRTLAIVGMLGLVVVGASGVMRSAPDGDSGERSAFALNPTDHDLFAATMLSAQTYESDGLGVVLQSQLLVGVTQLVSDGAAREVESYPSPIVRVSETKSGRDAIHRGALAMPSIVGQYLLSYGPIGPAMIGAFFGAVGAGADRFHRRHRSLGFSWPQLLGIQLAAVLFVSYRALMGAAALPLVLAVMVVGAASIWPDVRDRFAPVD